MWPAAPPIPQIQGPKTRLAPEKLKRRRISLLPVRTRVLKTPRTMRLDSRRRTFSHFQTKAGPHLWPLVSDLCRTVSSNRTHVSPCHRSCMGSFGEGGEATKLTALSDYRSWLTDQSTGDRVMLPAKSLHVQCRAPPRAARRLGAPIRPLPQSRSSARSEVSYPYTFSFGAACAARARGPEGSEAPLLLPRPTRPFGVPRMVPRMVRGG